MIKPKGISEELNIDVGDKDKTILGPGVDIITNYPEATYKIVAMLGLGVVGESHGYIRLNKSILLRYAKLDPLLVTGIDTVWPLL